MRGYRCLKCIYLTIHHPEYEAPITPETQALFDQGNAVGCKAREYFPNGTLIDNKPWDFTGALSKTRQLMADKTTTIYEAAFEYAGCYARADVIQYNPETKRWRIYEVKSSTKVKPEHYDDIGLQAWIMAKSGLPLEQINIVHLNPDCRYPNLENLFSIVDVTQAIRDRYLDVQPKIKEILETIRQPDVPDIDIGPYCLAPTECGFVDHCFHEKHIPPLSIFDLPGIKQHKWELYADGIISLDDPRLGNLTELQSRMVNCFKTNERYIDKANISSALSTWQFPLIFLDFETINPAIPRYDDCRPFEHTPFQFSVHKLASLESSVEHADFLHDTPDDPRPALIPALLEACGESGSIVAYFGRFEAERIEALTNYSPKHHDSLMKLIERIVDPLPIIRESTYDNAFHGSFSLKRVAPGLLGDSHSYENMVIANGNDAQRAFEELISLKTTAQRKDSLKKAMLDYCEKDTYVMVELVKWLYAATNSLNNM